MKPVNRQILALAIPAIIANITTPLLSIADVTIVGHLGSAVYLAAIAIGGSMFNMVYWLFGFLRMGSSGLTAQAFGANDNRSASLVLYRALTVAFIAGCAIIAVQTPLAEAVLRFMDADAETCALARKYFSICVYGAPAVLATYSLYGWLLGMQNSRAQMWISLVINLFNIAASVTLVYGFNLGIAGVATGTLSAQWVGALTGLWICRRYKLERASISEILRMSELRRFFAVNLDILLRTACLIAVTVWFTRTGARQSTVMLDVNALLMQMFMLFSYFMDGFAYAGEALCGRYSGAGDTTGLRHCIRALIRWGVLLASVFTIVYLAGGSGFIALMSGEREVVERSGEYLYWAATVPAAGFLAFTWDGILIGVTHTRVMLASMLCATILFFIIYFIAYPAIGNHGLWLAFVAYLLARGLFQSVASRRMLAKDSHRHA